MILFSLSDGGTNPIIDTVMNFAIRRSFIELALYAIGNVTSELFKVMLTIFQLPSNHLYWQSKILPLSASNLY